MSTSDRYSKLPLLTENIREKKTRPKTVAIVDEDNCTGCQVCIPFCPVDCIDLNQIGLGTKGNQSWCEIDLERCVGCEVCVHIPTQKSNPYELVVCPWDAIDMMPLDQYEEKFGTLPY